VHSLGARAVPLQAAPTQAVDPNAEVTDPPPPVKHLEIRTEEAGPPLMYTVTIRPDAAPAPKENPDLAVVAAGRASAAGCFTGISDGSNSRSASIRVTVLPSGTVNRSEVSSGNTTEPGILSCLEGVGDGLHFSDRPAADIRTYSIDVTVTRAH
jgi:hypothetical protein